MLAPNHANNGGRLAAVARLGAQAAGYLAARAANGAIRGASKRLHDGAYRYFKGDVSQPITSRTAQQLSVMRPVLRRYGRVRQQGNSASVTEKGSLKLGDVLTPAGTLTSEALMSLPMTCERIGGRLFAMSKLYSRWKFTSAILRYVPAVSSATDGSIVVFYSQDPDDFYATREVVGAANATAAIDNMECSVREKMNMKLHLPSTQLYTVPSQAEKTWHSAGVVTIVNNGALTTNKVYGSLYLDFVVTFSQPCAPFDPYSPIFSRAAVVPTGTGSGSYSSAVDGVVNGPLFNWVNDVAKMESNAGEAWFIDPDTGRPNTYGAIVIPPFSSCYAVLVFRQHAGAVNVPTIDGTGIDVNAYAVSGFVSFATSDNTVGYWAGALSNTGPKPVRFGFNAHNAGLRVESAELTVTTIPYIAAW
jgi:hypothetical protein